jgi:hypothetical protein
MCTEADCVIHNFTQAKELQVLCEQILYSHIKDLGAPIITHSDHYCYSCKTSACIAITHFYTADQATITFTEFMNFPDL